MRVLLLAHTFSDDGDEGEVRIVWESANALANAGISIFVVTNYFRLVKSSLPSNIKVYQTPFGSPSMGLGRANMLKVFLYSLPLIFLKKIDVIHLISTNSLCPFSYFKIKPFVMSADSSWEYENSKYGQDLIYDRRKKREEFGLTKKENVLKKIWTKIAVLFFNFFNLNEDLPRNVDLYICRTIRLKERLEKEKYPSKIIYVPHGVDINVFRPEIKPIRKLKNNFIFIFIGRISKRKGVEYLIKSFNKLYHKYQNIELLLIGKGASSTTKYFHKIAGPNIKFVGQINSNLINKYYSYSDVVVLPSLGEPCSLVAREAMACGKPVIATRAGGFLDLIKNNETGLLVRPADKNDLFIAMEKLLVDRNLAKGIGARARQYVKKELTWDLIAKRIIDGYQSVLKK